MATNSLEVALINNKGVSIVFPDASASSLTPDSAAIACGNTTLSATVDGSAITFGAPGTGTAIPNGGKFLLTWTCDDAAATGSAVGDKFKATLSFDYTNVETTQTIGHTGSADGKYT